MNILKYERVLFAALFSFLVSSCTQDDETLRFGFQDELGNLISEYDTLETETYVVYNDSVKSKGVLNSLFGHVKDEVFGSTYAKANISFSTPQDTLWGSAILDSALYDSVELVLSYNYVFGDTTDKVPFKVHELGEKLDSASEYYIFQDIPLKDQGLLTTFDYSPNERNNQVVRLSDEFGKSIFDNRAKFLDNSEEFLNFFKGIAIFPASKDGDFMLGINRYSNDGATSYLRIAYRTGKNDTEGENYLYLFADGSLVFNHMEKDFTGSELEVLQQFVRNESGELPTELKPIPTSEVGNKCYIENSTGISTYMKFPTLQDSVLENPDGRYPNDFTISLRPIEGSADVVGRQISSLVFYYANPDGLNYQLTNNGLPFLANTLGTTSTLDYLFKGRSYTSANLTGYFHEVLIGATQNNGLQIRSSYVSSGTLSDNNYSIERVVFGDSNSQDRPLLVRYYNTRSQK